jgi:hypothetical protein
VSDMTSTAEPSSGSSEVTVAELLRRASRSRPDTGLTERPAPPPPSDQIWVGTLLRREGCSPAEDLGFSTAPADECPSRPIKKMAVASGALLAAGALAMFATLVNNAQDGASRTIPGQGGLEGLTPAQLGRTPVDAAKFGGAAKLSLGIPAGVAVPGLAGVPGGGGGGLVSGGGGPAASGPVNNTVGTAGHEVGNTATRVGAALPQPVGAPVQQLSGAVSTVSTGVPKTAGKVLASAGSALSSITQPIAKPVNNITAPAGSLLGGLAR